MEISEIISDVRKKREFREIDDAFLIRIVNPLVAGKDLSKIGRDAAEKIVKASRAKLREVYGAFLSPDFFKRERYLLDISSLQDVEAHKKILNTHISTRERLPLYKEVYDKIFAVTGVPVSVLDLGCGLNPFSIPFMEIVPVYYAGELVKADADFIQQYFDKVGIQGKAFQVDLTRVDEELPSADVCFLFKVLDTLEALSWDITAELLGKLKVKWIVASFSTKSLGGRKTIHKRDWFERLIASLEHKVFEIPNEIFYIIRRQH